MSYRIKNYGFGYKITSLALNSESRDELLSQGLNVLYTDRISCTTSFMPENETIFNDKDLQDVLETYNSYDVFEIWDDGTIVRKYNAASGENYFFITGRCNSNCIMCPSPEYSRRSQSSIELSSLMQLAKQIPSDVRHLTITGGEPFLMRDDFFTFLQLLKCRFVDTEFLLLTNGRAFAVNRLFTLFCESSPNNITVAIPLHGSSEMLHDNITRSPGSFAQTKLGIKRLIKSGCSVEIRLVVSKLNMRDFGNIAELIVRELRGIAYISIIAMEMTGAARFNLEEIWVSYKQSFVYIADAIRLLVGSGIDVKLYNFPLCTVDRPFWALCEKSISTEKVRFAEKCDLCKFKSSCGGVFAGTLNLERDELEPIL